MDRTPNAICAASGFMFKMSELVRQWDGAYVHPRYVDERHPMDSFRVRPEQQPRVTQPEAPDAFITAPITPDML